MGDCIEASCKYCISVSGFIQSMIYPKREGLLKPKPVLSWKLRNRVAKIIFSTIGVIVTGVFLALILRWLGL